MSSKNSDTSLFSSVRRWKKKADKGDSRSQFLYGMALIKGVGVGKDLEKGFLYLTIAADNKYIPACVYLGEHFIFNKVDIRAGVRYLRIAAQENDRKAIEYLKWLYKLCKKNRVTETKKQSIFVSKKLPTTAKPGPVPVPNNNNKRVFPAVGVQNSNNLLIYS